MTAFFFILLFKKLKLLLFLPSLILPSQSCEVGQAESKTGFTQEKLAELKPFPLQKWALSNYAVRKVCVTQFS